MSVPSARDDASPVVVQPRGDVPTLFLCVMVGVVMAVLPHLLWWPAFDAPTYIADRDDVLYLTVASQSYREHPGVLSDPTQRQGGVTSYNRLTMTPGILLAKLAGAGPLGINLAWRIFGGLTIGAAWYFVVRQYVGRPWLAGALVLILLTDAGIGHGEPGFYPARVCAQLARGHSNGLFDTYPRIQKQWRIITPALSQAFLLLHLGLVARACRRPTTGRILAAGVGFGLLFYAYFYYWTAAGLALLLALILDAGHRKALFLTGMIGSLVGLPAVVASALVKSSTPSDWLHRTDNFLPIARGSELLLPKLSILLTVACLAWIAWRRRDLIYPGALTASGLLLLNHQVLSGLQIQNFHWIYVSGVVLSLLLILLLAEPLNRRGSLPKAWKGMLLVLVLAELASGFWLRRSESYWSEETREILAAYRRYRDQRQGPGVVPLAPHSVVAGDLRFVEFAMILEAQLPVFEYATLFNANLTNDQVADRIALNAALAGQTRQEFAEVQSPSLQTDWGPWSRSKALRDRRIAAQLVEFDAFVADPEAILKPFGVRYVGIRRGTPQPSYLKTGWRRLQDGPSWEVWEHLAATDEAAP